MIDPFIRVTAGKPFLFNRIFPLCDLQNLFSPAINGRYFHMDTVQQQERNMRSKHINHHVQSLWVLPDQYDKISIIQPRSPALPLTLTFKVHPFLYPADIEIMFLSIHTALLYTAAFSVIVESPRHYTGQVVTVALTQERVCTLLTWPYIRMFTV